MNLPCPRLRHKIRSRRPVPCQSAHSPQSVRWDHLSGANSRDFTRLSLRRPSIIPSAIIGPVPRLWGHTYVSLILDVSEIILAWASMEYASLVTAQRSSNQSPTPDVLFADYLSLVFRRRGLMKDRETEFVSDTKFLSQARTETGEIHFPSSIDHEQDWQPSFSG